MESSNIALCAWLEMAVMTFQVLGFAALFVMRIFAHTPWGNRGRTVMILSLIGLGIAGALCGGVDSEFGLFAGGTMTLLLIGMTVGEHHEHQPTPAPARAALHVAELAA